MIWKLIGKLISWQTIIECHVHFKYYLWELSVHCEAHQCLCSHQLAALRFFLLLPSISSFFLAPENICCPHLSGRLLKGSLLPPFLCSHPLRWDVLAAQKWCPDMTSSLPKESNEEDPCQVGLLRRLAKIGLYREIVAPTSVGLVTLKIVKRSFLTLWGSSKDPCQRNASGKPKANPILKELS